MTTYIVPLLAVVVVIVAAGRCGRGDGGRRRLLAPSWGSSSRFRSPRSRSAGGVPTARRAIREARRRQLRTGMANSAQSSVSIRNAYGIMKHALDKLVKQRARKVAALSGSIGRAFRPVYCRRRPFEQACT